MLILQSLKILQFKIYCNIKKNSFLKIPEKFNNVNMDGNSHYHKQIGQECLQKGSCDYGLYPLKTRFYMDQIPLDLFQYGKRSLNPIGADNGN